MKKSKESYSILALHDAADEIEQIMNDLRNKGVAAKATVVEDMQALSQQISDHDFDLVLSQLEVDGFEVTEVLEQIERLEKNLPIICLIDEYDAELIGTLLAGGIANAIPIGDTQYSGYMIKRELESLRSQKGAELAALHLTESERRCNLLLASSRDAIAYIADGMHILANEAYINLFQFEEPDDIEGLPLMDIIDEESHDTLKNAMRQLLQDKLSETHCSVKCLTFPGDKMELECIILPALYEGERCIQLMLLKKQSPQQDHKLQQRLEELSKRCAITGLSNRQHFETELESIMTTARAEDKSFVLLYIHLDELAKNRAKIGVDGIDLVATDTANLLREHFPPETLLARLSEDNFAALVRSEDDSDPEALAKSLCEKIKNHLYECENDTITLSSNVGIAQFDENIKESRQLISRAFTSCHEAQTSGKNTISRFVKADEDVIADQTASAHELQKAIDNNLFKILFQPIISMVDSDAEFYEVLLRRVNENGKLESPEGFLATAEAAQVATIVDRWVILQSVKALISKHMEGKNTKIIINLTSQSLLDSTFVPWLTVALKATRLPPQSVVFQVNHESAAQHIKRVQELGNALSELNCQISISRFTNDDKTEVLLTHIKPSFTKVDANFTKELHTKNGKENLKDLLLKIHAANAGSMLTFVENATTLAMLWQLGAHYMQGYYLQPPMEHMTYDFSQEEDEV